MSVDQRELFVSPETLYRESQSEHLSAFRALQRMQYDFDEETLDRNMLYLQKVNYWEQLRNQVLSVVASPAHRRFRQIGFPMGYDSSGIVHIFGDSVIESLTEKEILVIRKNRICIEAGIRARVLDKDWRDVLKEGLLIDHEENTQTPPRFSFILQFGDQRQRCPDWGGLGEREVRFDVPSLTA